MNEDTVCSYIESLVEGNYDEDGEIMLSNMVFDKSKWMDPRQYTKVMSIGQIFGLIISISIFLSILSYSCYLHSKLTRRRPWRKPKIDKKSPEYLAGKLSKNNSGITSARSYPCESLIGEDECSTVMSGLSSKT